MQSFDFLFNSNFPWAMQGMVVAIVVAVVCSLLSVVVVLKRMSFVGQGVSHAGFGAAGLAFLVGLDAMDWRYDLLLYVFCIATALTIGAISRRRRVDADTAIGILLVAGMALGVFLRNLSVSFQDPGGSMYWNWYAKEIASDTQPVGFESLLFGSLLSTTPDQMTAAILVGVLVLIVFCAFFKEIIFYAFDEPTSRVFGVRSGMVHMILMGLLAVAVVMTMKLAGVLMVSAMLVIPGATALLLSRRMGVVLISSCALGVLGAAGGVIVSLEIGMTGPGPCIVAVLLVEFAFVYLLQSVRRRVR